MSKIDYENQTNIIRDNTSKATFKALKIYSYEGMPGEEEFEFYFNHFQESLIRHSYYDIKPAYFYFRDVKMVNASAILLKSNFDLICINKGLFLSFHQKFVSYFDLNIFKNFPEIIALEKKLKDDLGELMFQVAILFTFYHELAHLIQFPKGKIRNETTEILTAGDRFDINEHVLEFDADTFATGSITLLVLNYIDKNEINQQELETFINLVSSVIFVYFFSFNTYDENIYFEKYSHPHPFIRCMNVVVNIVAYIEDIQLNKNEKASQEKLTDRLTKVQDISETLVIKLFDEKKFPFFETQVLSHFKEILKYYDKLRKLVMSDPGSAINIRNKIERERYYNSSR